MDVFDFNAACARLRAELRFQCSVIFLVTIIAVMVTWLVPGIPEWARWGSPLLALLALLPLTSYNHRFSRLRINYSWAREEQRMRELQQTMFKDKASGDRRVSMSASRVVELNKRVQSQHQRADDPYSTSSRSDDTLNTAMLISALDDSSTRSSYTPSSSYCSSSSYSSSDSSSSSSSDSGSSSSSCD